jgi:hypothetical protein
MSDQIDGSENESRASRQIADAGAGDESSEIDGPEGGTADGFETIERYETDGGVVFFDAENPLAWVLATRAVRLSECA